MTVFVDTSALYSLGSIRDPNHTLASARISHLIESERLLTHNYVVTETVALLHRRHGPRPVARVRMLLEAVECVWIDDELHNAALDRILDRGRDGPSFVDHVSFEVMERHGIDTAFAFDADFRTAGFRLVP